MPDSVAEAANVRAECIKIFQWLISHGWDVELSHVFKHHVHYRRWWNQQIKFGYLVHRFNITRQPGWKEEI